MGVLVPGDEKDSSGGLLAGEGVATETGRPGWGDPAGTPASQGAVVWAPQPGVQPRVRTFGQAIRAYRGSLGGKTAK